MKKVLKHIKKRKNWQDMNIMEQSLQTRKNVQH